MFILTHKGYPVSLHRSLEGAENMVKWLIENTNMFPADLGIRFAIVNDDFEPEYVN